MSRLPPADGRKRRRGIRRHQAIHRKAGRPGLHDLPRSLRAGGLAIHAENERRDGVSAIRQSVEREFVIGRFVEALIDSLEIGVVYRFEPDENPPPLAQSIEEFFVFKD